MSTDILSKPDWVTENTIEVYDYQPETLKEKTHCLGVDAQTKVKTLQIKNTEIIRVNNQRIIAYPTDTVNLSPSDFKIYEGSEHDDLDSPRVGIESYVPLDALHPPIIVNLREEAQGQNARETLRPYEIKYFHYKNNNVVIFIHGYNVAYGEYPKQISGLTNIVKDPLSAVSPDPFAPPVSFCQASPLFSTSDRTIYRSVDRISKHFGIADQPFFLRGFPEPSANNSDTSDPISGTEAHNWFLHMEDNLNCATGQFHRDNYVKYTRLIQVAWSGDVGEINYMAAEPKADAAGKRLVKLIQQLSREGIEINLIAHSLGARVALTAMNELGKDFPEIINHVFLWEAAVPQTALSNDPKKDTSIQQNGSFPNAAKAAQKITVLYSQEDWILHHAYYWANVLGIPPDRMTDAHYIEDRIKKNTPRQLFKNRDRSAYESRLLLESILTMVQGELQSQIPVYGQDDSSLQKIEKIKTKLTELYHVSGGVSEALGYAGPDADTKQRLEKIGKLISANTTQWIHSHSAMRRPTPAIMKHVYEKWIMNKKRGLEKFGRYTVPAVDED